LKGGGGPPPSHRLQAVCGVHADGPAVAFLADAAALFTHLGAPAMEVRIETRPEIRVAALAHVGPYNTIGAAFDRLGAIAGRAGLLASPAAQMIAVYHDDPETTPAAQLRSAAGVSVAAGAAIPPPLQELRLPAGRWACMLHRGSYAGLGDSWQRLLGQWLPASGWRLGAGECYELYLNHPGRAREEDLATLTYVPLEG
jgi:AraC family transcriptional regulator